ncbi:MAG: hypothetical protein IPP77_00445 [Bacteroidetes bacterium]|nr:hypothetical protein [Bacteroidota bacterium]
MKKIAAPFILIILFLITDKPVSAQGWNQDRIGIYSVGVGGVMAFTPGFNGGYGSSRYNVLTAPGLSLNVSGDFKVHRFISVGFHTGLDFFFYSDVASIGIPFVARGDVHILEAVNASVAVKLDVFAGVTIGGGPAFPLVSGGGVFGFLVAGPHAGVRYWVKPNFGVFAEAGWGATFLNGGVTF